MEASRMSHGPHVSDTLSCHTLASRGTASQLQLLLFCIPLYHGRQGRRDAATTCPGALWGIL